MRMGVSESERERERERYREREKYIYIYIYWDNTPLFVKYNPGLLDLLVLLDETSLQTGL